jgi:hypothetical protein
MDSYVMVTGNTAPVPHFAGHFIFVAETLRQTFHLYYFQSSLHIHFLGSPKMFLPSAQHGLTHHLLKFLLGCQQFAPTAVRPTAYILFS